jgi:Sulfotransferase family
MTLNSPTWQFSVPAQLHAFFDQVLASPELQRRLAPIADANAFIDEAMKVATESGIELDGVQLAGLLRPDPLGLGRFAAAPITCSAWPPAGWIPTRSAPNDGAPAFDWLYVGDRPLLNSFYEDEVRIAGALPFNWLFRIRTNMDAVIAGADDQDAALLPLQGLIFHMSRCGSTLLAQMLAAVPEIAVSSEPEPFDGVITWVRMNQIGEAEAIIALRAIVAALGRNRGTGATRHIIKLDAWHAFSMPLIRAAFPAVNWVHLYRNGVEVMVSTMQQPGVHTAPGMLPESVTGFAAANGMSHEEYAARVLAGIGQAVLTHMDLGGGMVVAYPDIIAAAIGPITNHFDLFLDDRSIAAMLATTQRDSKDSARNFSDDSTRKQAVACQSIALLNAVERWMTPVEHKLSQLSVYAG